MGMLRDMAVSVGGRRDSGSPQVGMLASQIPTGFANAALLANDIDPAYPQRLYHVDILTWDGLGDFFVFDTSAWRLLGAPNGVHPGTQRISKWDPGQGRVSVEDTTFSITLGAAPPADGVVPTITGTVTHSETGTTIAIDWSGTTSADNVAVARREYRIGGSGVYTAATSAEEISKSHVFAGLAAGTAYPIDLRCVDTSGNPSAALRVTATTLSGAMNTITCTLVTRGSVPQANLSGLNWALFAQLNPAQFLAPVAKGALVVTDGSAILSIPVAAAAAPVGSYMLALADSAGVTTLLVPVAVS